MTNHKITANIILKDGTFLKIDRTRIKTVSTLSQMIAENSTISYGILPSSGKIEILDIDGIIKKNIQEGIIDTSSVNIDIYFNDNLMFKHISSDSDYSVENSIFTINLTDVLTYWSEIQYKGYYYPQKPQTAYEMLVNVFSTINISQETVNLMLGNFMLDENYDSITIKEYLKKIDIKYPFLLSSTFQETINKFCTLAQLYLYLDNNGVPKFSTARPLLVSKNNIISIPKKNQYGVFYKSVLLKNKYDAVEIEKNYIEKQVKYNESVYSFYTDNIIPFKENAVDVATDVSQFGGFSDNFAIAYVYVEALYFQKQNIIPQFSNYNLDKIIEIHTGLDSDGFSNIKSKIDYTENIFENSNGEFIVTQYDVAGPILSGTLKGYINEEDIEYSNPNTIEKSTDSLGDNNISLNNEVSWAAGSGRAYAKAEISIKNKDNLSYTEYTRNDSGDYIIDTISLVGKKTHKLGAGETRHVAQGKEPFTLTGTTEIFVPKAINITVFGDVEKISYKTIQADSDNISNALNPISIQTNELVSTETKISNIEICDIIKRNILSDYKDGISNATIKVACTDYYNTNGEKIIDSQKGQVLVPDLYVKIEGDNNIWRITSVELEKSGYPFMNLDIIQVISAPINEYSMNFELERCSVVINRLYSENEDAIIGIISETDKIYFGDILTFKIVKESGSSITSLEVIDKRNGGYRNYIEGSKITVSSDIYLKCICNGWETKYSGNLLLGTTTDDDVLSKSIDGLVASNPTQDIALTRIEGYLSFYIKNGYAVSTENGLVFSNESEQYVSIYEGETWNFYIEDGDGNKVGNMSLMFISPVEEGVLKWIPYSSNDSLASFYRIRSANVQQFI